MSTHTRGATHTTPLTPSTTRHGIARGTVARRWRPCSVSILSWSPGESGSPDASRPWLTAVPARVLGRSESASDTRFPPRDRCRRSFADMVKGLYNSSMVEGSADNFPVSSMKFFSFQRYEQGTFFGKDSFHLPDRSGRTLFSFLPCIKPRPLSSSF